MIKNEKFLHDERMQLLITLQPIFQDMLQRSIDIVDLAEGFPIPIAVQDYKTKDVFVVGGVILESKAHVFETSIVKISDQDGFLDFVDGMIGVDQRSDVIVCDEPLFEMATNDVETTVLERSDSIVVIKRKGESMMLIKVPSVSESK